MKRLGLFSMTIAILAAPAGAAAQQSYNLIDLTAGSPYDQTQANSINTSGHVTGFGVIPSSGEIHAFIYVNGNFQDLGLLGYGASDGISINNADQLAVDGIGPGSTALFYSNGQASQIGNIDGGYTSAYAINDLGDIVGSGWNGDGGIVGFSWIGGVFTDLSPHGVYRATAINDSDQFVGTSIYSWVYGGYVHTSSHAFLCSGGVFTDLGSFTGNPQLNTEAFGINNSGQIVGYSTAANGAHYAFLYSGGTMQDIGTLGGNYSVAVAVNNNGVVVGNLQNPYGVDLGSYVYANGTMSDMSDLIASGGAGWSQLIVTGINDGGSIVGYGTLNGGTQGFVAVPINTADAGKDLADLKSGISGVQPNPFKPATLITFTLSQRGAVTASRLEIFDPTGRRLATLVDQRLAPGTHSITWNGRADGEGDLRSGVYFARLTTADGATSRKLILMK